MNIYTIHSEEQILNRGLGKREVCEGSVFTLKTYLYPCWSFDLDGRYFFYGFFSSRKTHVNWRSRKIYPHPVTPRNIYNISHIK